MVSLKHILAAFQARVQNGVSIRGALFFSVILHFGIVVVFGGIYAGKTLLKPSPKTELVFELDTEKDIEFVESTNSAPLPSDLAGRLNRKKATDTSPKSRGVKSSDSHKLISENVQTNKEQVLMASLASLTDLKDAFTFAVTEISADEDGAFTPIHGEAPDTGLIAKGLGEGIGLGDKIRAGISGGSGNCPPRPR